MKLGDKVTFKTDYVKSGNTFDPGLIGTLPLDQQEEIEGSGVTLVKMNQRIHKEEKTGIIAGKRYYSLETKFDYVECTPYETGDWRWQSEEQPRAAFYLVATNLNGFHKVREEDVKIVIDMYSDPIDFPIDDNTQEAGEENEF